MPLPPQRGPWPGRKSSPPIYLVNGSIHQGADDGTYGIATCWLRPSPAALPTFVCHDAPAVLRGVHVTHRKLQQAGAGSAWSGYLPECALPPCPLLPVFTLELHEREREAVQTFATCNLQLLSVNKEEASSFLCGETTLPALPRRYTRGKTSTVGSLYHTELAR